MRIDFTKKITLTSTLSHRRRLSSVLDNLSGLVRGDPHHRDRVERLKLNKLHGDKVLAVLDARETRSSNSDVVLFLEVLSNRNSSVRLPILAVESELDVVSRLRSQLDDGEDTLSLSMGDGELGASEDVVKTFGLRRVQLLDWSGRTRSGAHKAPSRTASATTATSAAKTAKTARRCETKNLGSNILNKYQRMALIP